MISYKRDKNKEIKGQWQPSESSQAEMLLLE